MSSEPDWMDGRVQAAISKANAILELRRVIANLYLEAGSMQRGMVGSENHDAYCANIQALEHAAAELEKLAM